MNHQNDHSYQQSPFREYCDLPSMFIAKQLRWKTLFNNHQQVDRPDVAHKFERCQHSEQTAHNEWQRFLRKKNIQEQLKWAYNLKYTTKISKHSKK